MAKSDNLLTELLTNVNTVMKQFINKNISRDGGAQAAIPDGPPSPEAAGGAIQASVTAISVEKIIQYITNHPGSTMGQICKAIGYTPAVIRPLMKDLRTQNIIKTEGVRRGTRYFMTEAAANINVMEALKQAINNAPAKPRGRPPGSKNKPKTDDYDKVVAELAAGEGEI